MNAIFAAQKQKVQIDVIRVDTESGGECTFLQQASYTTGGMYTALKAKEINMLPQYLLQLFSADQDTRGHLVLPKQ